MFKVEPMLGRGEDPLTGEIRNDIESPWDVIACYEAGKRIEVGFVLGKHAGAAVSFFRDLSDSQRKEALKAVAARDGTDEPRKTSKAGAIDG